MNNDLPWYTVGVKDPAKAIYIYSEDSQPQDI